MVKSPHGGKMMKTLTYGSEAAGNVIYRTDAWSINFVSLSPNTCLHAVDDAKENR